MSDKSQLLRLESFSARLRLKLELVMPILSASNDFFLERGNFAERFKIFLISVHSIIRASVPLMGAAEHECSSRDGDFYRALSNYYREHSAEELHHDDWLLEDLEVLGTGRNQVLSMKPSVAVAELVGSQYYWLYHLDPSCLLGYILVLEGYPMSPKDVSSLITKTGFPAKGFRTLMEHSSLDVYHLQQLDRTLDDLPLGGKREEWITLNAIYTAKKCSEIIDSL